MCVENVEQEIANYGKTSAQAEQGCQHIALVSTFAKQGHKPKVRQVMRLTLPPYLLKGLPNYRLFILFICILLRLILHVCPFFWLAKVT